MNGDRKEWVLQIIQRRGLCSCMNDTKWRELRTAVLQEIPFCPPYILKSLFEDTCPEEAGFQQDVWYLGDWNGGFGAHDQSCFAIEWIKVRPRYLKSRGRLAEPELVDAGGHFEEILRPLQIPYESENGMYCIYGYR